MNNIEILRRLIVNKWIPLGSKFRVSIQLVHIDNEGVLHFHEKSSMDIVDEIKTGVGGILSKELRIALDLSGTDTGWYNLKDVLLEVRQPLAIYEDDRTKIEPVEKR